VVKKLPRSQTGFWRRSVTNCETLGSPKRLHTGHERKHLYDHTAPSQM